MFIPEGIKFSNEQKKKDMSISQCFTSSPFYIISDLKKIFFYILLFNQINFSNLSHVLLYFLSKFGL